MKEGFPPSDQGVGPERSVIIFHLGKETFAFPAPIVQYVSEPKKIHGLPHHKSNLVKGIVNVDGQIKIALSLYQIFGVPETENPSRLMLVGPPGGDFVFMVDHLLGVSNYLVSNLHPTKKPFVLGIIPPIQVIDERLLFRHLGEIFHAG
jgi:chemotaxis signal transduction protein